MTDNVLCKKCNLLKSPDEFYKCKNKNGGLSLRHPCKKCQIYIYVVNKKCYRCDKEFSGDKKTQFCSKECKYENDSARMSFMHEKDIWFNE